MDTVARVRELVAPSVAAAGAEIYDVEMTGGVLRITLDRPDGVGLDTIATVTRAVSRLLDEADPIAGEYTLEVSSPGLERPLRTPEHFERAIGSTVTVKTRAGVPGDRRVKGVLSSADADGFTVCPDGTDEARTISYTEIERVRTVFDWGPAPKPGKPVGGAKKAAGTKAGPRKPKTSSNEKSSTEKKAAKSCTTT